MLMAPPHTYQNHLVMSASQRPTDKWHASKQSCKLCIQKLAHSLQERSQGEGGLRRSKEAPFLRT